MHNPLDIMVVDDDLPIVDLISEVLLDEGYRVRTTTSSTEVLALVRMQRPALLLIDLHMPNLNGIEVMNQLHSSGFADVPVVLVTASSEEGPDRANLAGRTYLLKPFDINELLACVARYARPPMLHASASPQSSNAAPPQRYTMAGSGVLALAHRHPAELRIVASSGRYRQKLTGRMSHQAARRAPHWLRAWLAISSPQRRVSRSTHAISRRAAPLVADRRGSPSVPVVQPDMAPAAALARLRAQTAEIIGALAQQFDRAIAARQQAARLLEASAQTRRRVAEAQARATRALQRS
jgi:CheY-like chemotaxis protein